jgi:hypothetical protein
MRKNGTRAGVQQWYCDKCAKENREKREAVKR